MTQPIPNGTRHEGPPIVQQMQEEIDKLRDGLDAILQFEITEQASGGCKSLLAAIKSIARGALKGKK